MKLYFTFIALLFYLNYSPAHAQINKSNRSFTSIEISQGIQYRIDSFDWSLDCYYKPHNEFTKKNKTRAERFCETVYLPHKKIYKPSTGWRISLSDTLDRNFEEIGYRTYSYRCSISDGRISIDGALEKNIYFKPEEYYNLVLSSTKFAVELGYPEWPTCVPRIVTRFNSHGLKAVIDAGFKHLRQPLNP